MVQLRNYKLTNGLSPWTIYCSVEDLSESNSFSDSSKSTPKKPESNCRSRPIHLTSILFRLKNSLHFPAAGRLSGALKVSFAGTPWLWWYVPIVLRTGLEGTSRLMPRRRHYMKLDLIIFSVQRQKITRAILSIFRAMPPQEFMRGPFWKVVCP